MRLRSYLAVALIWCSHPAVVLAQNQPASTVRTLLAAGRIGSVDDVPLAFRLLSVRLPVMQQASYTGPNAVLYAISGELGLQLGDNVPIAAGTGAFVASGRAAVFTAPGPQPAIFLMFILSPSTEAQKALLGSPAQVEELYRSPEPLPGLQAGPHEFSLTRVSLPAGMPLNPPHYRSGAALYYIASGMGAFSAGGKVEPRTAGMAHFEPRGLIHQWANPGDAPLVLIQANIALEGVPTVLSAGAK